VGEKGSAAASTACDVSWFSLALAENVSHKGSQTEDRRKVPGRRLQAEGIDRSIREQLGQAGLEIGRERHLGKIKRNRIRGGGFCSLQVGRGKFGRLPSAA
jgi:hypothetical protein